MENFTARTALHRLGTACYTPSRRPWQFHATQKKNEISYCAQECAEKDSLGLYWKRVKPLGSRESISMP
ncbi:UNVERIFIED_CONTAM: hypothetical protein FKN15_027675 [Acipenser sinensis]